MKIICPNCHEEFSLDDASSQLIQEQVEKRVKECDQYHREELTRIKAQHLEDLEFQKNQLKEQADKDKELAVSTALTKQNSTIVSLQTQLQSKDVENQLAVDKAIAETTSSLTLIKNKEIAELQTCLTKANAELQAKDSEMEAKLKTFEASRLQELMNTKNDLEESHKATISELQSKCNESEARYFQIYKEFEDFKQYRFHGSTKRLGENFEQWFDDQYNKIRPLLKNASFEKDTKAVGTDTDKRSKGDFIFRDFDNGEEVISIEFELKTEDPSSKQKQKNSDHFDKLDKDRKKKNCEYAVLVSTLEENSEFYNQGIVEAPGYDKMYVIRPNLFITMICILRNAALNSVKYKRLVEEYKSKEVDVTNFEANLDKFKQGFLKNVERVGSNHAEAINKIDDAIRLLNSIKDLFAKSDNNMRLANDKLEALTIRKLTYNNPTMTDKFKKAAEVSESIK